ncbi:MRGRD protein, partial [Probosciger aterrimus]|nr:MRGRD protein [Probosciger aterrimus]
ETNTTDLSLNSTRSGNWSYEGNDEYPCLRAPHGFMVFMFVCMGICVFGMVGNGIVLWFLGFQMKRNYFTVYILNLAVADCSLLLLFFLLILAYFNMTVICYCLDSFVPFYQKFVEAVEFLSNFFVLCSLGLLTAISTERCVSVL